MLTTEMARTASSRAPCFTMPGSLPGSAARAGPSATERIAPMLRRLADGVALVRTLVHAGDSLYSAGAPFVHLYVVNSGLFKVAKSSPDGRCQMVDLQFRGDWMGLDGIAVGLHTCEAVAMDTGEVWALRYDELLQACAFDAAMMFDLHREMSRAIARAHDALLSRGLPATARVADFLCQWAGSLAARGQRPDRFRLHMSRAEIGNYLGMTSESVCRALTLLARRGVVQFTELGRREVVIPDLQALGRCVQATEPAWRGGMAVAAAVRVGATAA